MCLLWNVGWHTSCSFEKFYSCLWLSWTMSRTHCFNNKYQQTNYSWLNFTSFSTSLSLLFFSCDEEWPTTEQTLISPGIFTFAHYPVFNGTLLLFVFDIMMHTWRIFMAGLMTLVFPIVIIMMLSDEKKPSFLCLSINVCLWKRRSQIGTLSHDSEGSMWSLISFARAIHILSSIQMKCLLTIQNMLLLMA